MNMNPLLTKISGHLTARTPVSYERCNERPPKNIQSLQGFMNRLKSISRLLFKAVRDQFHKFGFKSIWDEVELVELVCNYFILHKKYIEN